MLKIIFGIIFFSINVQAYQCQFKSHEDVISKSKYVFIGKVIANDGKIATLEVIKKYKGSLEKNVRVQFIDHIAINYHEINKFKIGLTLIVSTNDDFSKRDETLILSRCGYSYDPSSAKPIMDILEKKFKK